MIAQIVDMTVAPPTCKDCIVVDPTAVVASGGARITWGDGEFDDAPPGTSFMMQPDAGIGWTLSGDVLVAPAVAAPTKVDLIAYANAQQWALATGGFSVTVAGATHVFATDVTSLSLMDGKVARLAQPNPPASFNWQLGDASWLVIAAADFPAIATACADFFQGTFDFVKAVQAAIDAGTLTTFAQIDDPTTAGLPPWPASA
jgi:hypothetical protein